MKRSKTKSNRKQRLNGKRRRRGMILESLEDRQLLAAVTQALPSFSPVDPLGSQVHASMVAEEFGATPETDTFTFDVEAGQLVTVVLEPDGGTIEANVDLIESGAGSIGSSMSAGAGSPVVIQTVSAAVSGSHQIEVSNTAGSGTYELTVILNSLLEDEATGGASNDTIATAQSLTASSVAVAASDRLNVIGFSDDDDHYSFDLTAGERASLVLSVDGNEDLDVELIDPSGAVVAAGVEDATNVDEFIAEFLPSSSGTYTARVSGGVLGDSYSLTVTRGASFQLDLASGLPNVPATNTVIGRAGTGGYFDGFESGVLGPEWTTNGGNRIQVANTPSVGDGNFALLMDNPGGTSLNEATLTVDLTGPGPTLSFLHSEYGDEHATIPLDYAGSANGDGISISTDGTNWRRIFDPPNQSSGVWTPYTIDLVGEATAAGITLTSTTQIKFQQFDNSAFTVDGRGWDNVTISGGGPFSFEIDAAVGDSLQINTFTPGDLPQQPVNDIDPFLELFDPTDTSVATDDNSAGDGKNAVVNHNTATAGLYELVTSGVSGNGDLVVTFSGSTATTSSTVDIVSADVADGAAMGTFPATLQIELSQSVLLTSVDPGDLTINGAPATAVNVIDGRRLEFDVLALDGGSGTYNVAIALDAFSGLGGESSTSFASTFTVDQTPPMVTRVLAGGVEVTDGDVIDAGGPLQFTIELSEPIDENAVNTSGISFFETLTSQTVFPDAINYVPGSTEVTIDFATGSTLGEGSYDLTLPSFRFVDLFGNQLDGDPVTVGAQPFVFNLNLDAPAPIPLTIDPLAPLGSLIYHQEIPGILHDASDVDEFTVDLDAGQTLAVALTASAGTPFQGRVTIVPPAGGSTTVTAAAAGDPVVVQTIPVTTAATYSIQIESIADAGTFDLEVLVNAVFDDEALSGANDTIATAAPIDASSVALPNGGSRLGVLGQIESNGAMDVYSFSIGANEATTIAVEAFGAAPDLELFDGAGNLIAMGAVSATGLIYINDFVDPAGGTFFAKLTGAVPVDYSMAVLRGATSDIDDGVPGQPIGVSGQVVSSVGASSTASGTSGIPVNLNDVNGLLWDIQQDGSISNGSSDAYDGGMDNTSFASVSGPVPTEENGREIILGTTTLGTVELVRKIFVPDNGGFARFLDVYTNTGAAAVTQQANFDTNLGSDGGTINVATASGDLVVGIDDGWIVTDDGSNGGGDPAVGHVVGGAGALAPTTFAAPTGSVLYSYDLTLAPGETQIIMTFGVQNFDRTNAVLEAQSLHTPGGIALSGMTPSELSQVVNFNLPVPGQSYLFDVTGPTDVTLTTSTPGDGPLQPANTANPTIELFDPAGNPIAIGNTGSVDGRNEQLTVPITTAGTYRVELSGVAGFGAVVLTITDSNGTVAAPPLQLDPADPLSGDQLPNLPPQFEIDASEILVAQSIDASDLLITAPDSSIFTPATVAGNADVLVFDLTGLAGPDGVYTATIAPNSLTGVSGQTNSSFTSTFVVDTTPPMVTSVAVNGINIVTGTEFVAAGPTNAQIVFSEELLAAELGAEDLVLTNTTSGQIFVPSTFIYNPLTDTLDLTWDALNEGAFQLMLTPGIDAFEDLVGNPLVPFSTGFLTDIVTAPFPVPLPSVLPLGSLIYGQPLPALFHQVGDVDQLTIDLNADQLISLQLLPQDPSIQAEMTLLAPDGSTVGNFAATLPGQPIVLNSLPVAQDGIYTISTNSLAGTGEYDLLLLLNSAFELEPITGVLNDSVATAENLTPAFLDVAPGASADRGAVVGELDAGASDFYSFSLTAGEITTIVATGLESLPTLTLFGPAGALLTLGTVLGTNVTSAIENLQAPTTGTYSVRVDGAASGDYSLVVTRDATFDLEPNQSISDGQELVLTSVGGTLSIGQAFGSARAAESADIIFVVDESGSMDTEHDFLNAGGAIPSVITELDAELNAAGVTGNRYAILGYGSSGQAAGRVVSQFGDAMSTALDADNLETSGSFEDGYRAIVNAFNSLSLRNDPTVTRQIVLVTDEDRDFGDATTFEDIVALAEQHQADVSSIVNISLVDAEGFEALGIASDGLGGPGATFVEIVGGGFRVSPTGSASGGDGSTLTDYVELSWEIGGSVYDLNRLRDGGNAADSFKNAFVDSTIRSDSLDIYNFDLVAGDTIEIEIDAPNLAPGEALNQTGALIELFDPELLLVATDDGTSDGSGLPRIQYSVPAEADGQYAVRIIGLGIRDYLLTVTRDGVPLPSNPPFIVDSTPVDAEKLIGPTTVLTIEYSEPLRLDTVDITDVQFADPGVSVDGINVIDSRTIEYALTVPDIENVYTYTVGAGAVLDLQGLPIAETVRSFEIDRGGPRVLNTLPTSQVARPFTELTFVFDEGIDPSSLQTSDVVTFTGPTGNNLLGQINGISVVDNHVTVTFTAQTVEGTYTFALGPNITDVIANVMDQDQDGTGGEAVDDVFTTTVILQAPDLVPTIDAAPASAQFGDTFNVTYTVTNDGLDPASEQWSDRIYLSTNNTLDAGDIVLKTVPDTGSFGPLASTANYNQVESVTLPVGLNSGNYFILVVTDWAQTQPDEDEGNNVASQLISLTTPPIPDLVVSNIIAPAQAVSTQQITIDWTITNQGTGDLVNSTFRDRVFLSPDPAIGGDQFFGNFEFTGSIPAGQSINRSETIDLPFSIQGEHFVVIRTDVDNDIFEDTGENNNISIDDLPIDIELAPSVSINDVSITETDAGTATIDFTVSLSAASGFDMMVDFATSNGSATQPNDYTSNSGTLTIMAGDLTATVSVDVAGDLLSEIDETFFVTLSNPVNSTIGDGVGEGTILDNDPLPTLSIDDVTVTEIQGSNVDANFTVTLSEPSGQEITVGYQTNDGSAVSPDDFAATNGTLTFLPGVVSQTVGVNVAGDAVDENDETFTVELDSPTAANIDDGSGQGTIIDSALPTVTIDDVSVNEDAGTASFTVSLSQTSDDNITLTIGTADATAIAPGDYSGPNTQVTILAGSLTAAYDVSIVNDPDVESDETYVVSVVSVDAGSVEDSSDTGLGTIVDNDVIAPNVMIDDVTVNEGDTASFTISLSSPATDEIVLTIGTTNGTAASPGDYLGPNAQVTIAANTSSTTFDVSALLDGLFEGAVPEDFTVGVVSVDAGTVGNTSDTGLGQIVDIDVAPNVLIADASAAEDADPAEISFDVSLSGPSSNEITLTIGTTDGSATSPDDFMGANQSITFLAGDTTATYTAMLVDDNVQEGDETFSVGIVSVDAGTVGNTSDTATGTILDNETAPSVIIGDVIETEGQTAIFDVSLSGTSDQDVVLTIGTVDGTAISPDDFSGPNTQVTIPANSTSQMFSVALNLDNLFEGATPETYTVGVVSVDAGIVSDFSDTGLGEIIDSDAAPDVMIGDAVAAEDDALGEISFDITLSHPSANDIALTIGTLDGTATSPDDFDGADQLITILAGDVSATYAAVMNDDDIDEPDETFTVRVVDGIGIGDVSDIGTGTILDDEDTPEILIDDVIGNEGTTASFSVSLSGPSSQNTVVTIGTSDGSANSPDDYNGPPTQLTIPAGTTSATMAYDVSLEMDAIAEPDETFNVVVQSVDNGVANANDVGIGTIVSVNTSVIIDNGDPEYGTSGNWTTINGKGKGHLNDFDLATAGGAADTATWTFDIEAPGEYGTWVSYRNFSNRATNAPYTVFDGGAELVTTQVDQTTPAADIQDDGTWFEYIGNYTIFSDQLIVSLGDNANGFLSADAVRIQLIGQAQDGPEILVESNGATVVDDTGIVDLGDIGLGSNTTQQFSIANTGNQDLILVEPIALPPGFSLVSSFSALTLPPGASASFEVQADTSQLGPIGGEISFANNDADEQPFNFIVEAEVVSNVIIDNGDPGYSTSGNWNTITGNGKGFQNDFQYSQTSLGYSQAIWTFTVAPGQYEVSASWQPFSNRATNAMFAISDESQILATATVNQQQPADTLVDQGRGFEILSNVSVFGNQLTVTLDNVANGLVIADAIRIARTGDVILNPEITVSTNGANIDDNTGVVDTAYAIGSPVTQIFTISNTGSTPLTLNEPISLPAGITLQNSFGTTTVPPGGSTNFVIIPDTSNVGTYGGTVSFGNNDSDENPFNFTLNVEITEYTVIVDDGDPEHSTIGNWVRVNRNGFNGDFEYALAGTGSSQSLWSASLPDAGQYRISVSYRAWINRATDAPFSVLDGGNSIATVNVDQTTAGTDVFENGIGFRDLGVFSLTQNNLTVMLTNDANGLVVADAIRIERVG